MNPSLVLKELYLTCRVDALLDGGFRQGQLTELAGETAAGKSQVRVDVQAGCFAYVVTVCECLRVRHRRARLLETADETVGEM